MAELLARWPVYCTCKRGRRLFYRVCVFDDVDFMRDFLHEQAKQLHYRPEFKACQRRGYFARTLACVTYWVPVPKNGSNFIGTIAFCSEHIGSGIVSHEMTHAALYYCYRARKNFDPRKPAHDELLAWTQGWLTTQFWRKFCRLFEEKTDANP